MRWETYDDIEFDEKYTIEDDSEPDDTNHIELTEEETRCFAEWDDEISYMNIDISNLSENLRKVFKIPESFKKAYFVQSSSFNSIMAKLKAGKHVQVLEYDDGALKETDFSGVFRTRDFIVVSKLMWSRDGANSLNIVFTDDIEKVKSFFRRESEFKTGVYEIKHNMFGAYLSPVKVENIPVPVLNDNLFERMRSEIETFIRKEDVYRANDLPYKRGVLLYGAPGNGKTTFIKHMLSKIDALSVIADSKEAYDMMFIRSLLKNEKLRDTLKIVVMEDVDGQPPRTRSNFLNMIDGIMSSNKTIFIATTNFPNELDIGIRNRPSRFDSFFEIGDPNEESRRTLLKSFFPSIKDKVLAEAVEKTKSFRGAHFKEIYILSQLEELDVLSAIDRLNSKFKDFLNYEKNLAYIG